MKSMPSMLQTISFSLSRTFAYTYIYICGNPFKVQGKSVNRCTDNNCVLTIRICSDPVLPVLRWIFTAKCKLGWIWLALIVWMSHAFLCKCSFGVQMQHYIFLWMQHLAFVVVSVLDYFLFVLVLLVFIRLRWNWWIFRVNFPLEHMENLQATNYCGGTQLKSQPRKLKRKKEKTCIFQD